jgi:diguanylate cyclase (GGDEF)-like protein
MLVLASGPAPPHDTSFTIVTMQQMSFVTSSRLDAEGSLATTTSRAVRDLYPFIATTVLAWIAATIGTPMNWYEYVGSALVVLASWALGVTLTARGEIRPGTVLGALGFLAGVGLLRQAAGGSTSGVSGVALLAVFQTALYLRRRQDLLVVLLGLAAMYLVPLLFIGAPRYPSSGYRGTLLTLAVSAVFGLVTQNLVADIRRRAAQERSGTRMLAEVNQILQKLFDSPDARADVCKAVKKISGATAALLFESSGDGAGLHLTAGTIENPSAWVETPAASGSAVEEAFSTQKPLLISEAAESRVANIGAWRAAGSPTSILYKPLVHDGRPLGVLVVGWDDVTAMTDPRVAMASVLGHEGASVIARADVIDHLTDEAHTDPLTRLPNRRAWDSRLALALAEDESLAVVLLDLDHFKHFNDTYGHPAGDVLLQHAGTAWRSVIRDHDFLARLGGEEFGVLIFSADREAIARTVERIRAQVPREETCSAGIAFREPGESTEALITRADQALYEAKTSGRDRAIVSGGQRAAAETKLAS